MDTNETTSSGPKNGSSPERYIRTFSGDIQVFKKGGAPDLAPFVTPQSSPSERLIEASPLPAAPQPVSAPTPPPLAPEQKPVPLSEEEKPTPLKTYSGDFSERLHETRASTATVLAAEQDAASWSSSAEVQEEPSRYKRWFIAGGMLLFIVGGAGGYIVYSRYAAALSPIIVAPGATTPIFVDSHERISGNDSALMQAIKQSANKPLLLNTIRALSLTGAPDGATVFSSLSVHAPDILLRNIDSAGSMAGIVNASGGQAPFFILSVGSYRATFSGMLSWERTILTDLGPFFPMYVAVKTTASPLSTTTPATVATTTPIVAARSGFRDETVSNHDVRIYRDTEGRSIMLYGYWDQATLVIARDPAAFTEVLARLATSRGR